MEISMTVRRKLANAGEIVVKVGTKVLIGEDGSVASEILHRLVDSIARLRSRGSRVVLVSSGAVGIGAKTLGVSHELASVCAAAGQSVLTSLYQRAFGEHDIRVAQLLVTAEDFATPARNRQLIQTICHLIEAGAVPILNENDVISDSVMRASRIFSENDMLASLIARDLHADLLVFLTDVDGVYDLHPQNPEAALISELQTEDIGVHYESSNGTGRGGVQAKVKAAIHATRDRHTIAIIANGRTPNVLERILSGDRIGTLVASPEVQQ
jgi:glutamate 5-kinase